MFLKLFILLVNSHRHLINFKILVLYYEKAMLHKSIESQAIDNFRNSRVKCA